LIEDGLKHSNVTELKEYSAKIMSNNQPSLIFTDKDKKLLKNLKEIIDFGNSQITGSYNINSFNNKQLTIFLAFGAINNYSGAIYKLCEDFRAIPAIVLLRSVFEAYINIFYITKTNSDKRIVLFWIEAWKDRITMLNELTSFRKKYPNHKNIKSFMDESTVAQIKLETEQKIKNTRKNHKLTTKQKHPDLITVTRKLDQAIPEKSRNGKFEYNYHILYRYFSPFAHLNASGINNFLKQKPDGSHDFITNQSNDLIGEVLASTFSFYLEFLSYLKKYKLLDKKISLTKFNKMFRNDISKKKN